jgi:hypothetical protein
MKYISNIIVAIISFVLGGVVISWSFARSDLEQSYWFILQTNQLIYEASLDDDESIRKLNNILYVHINGVKWSQAILPAVFSGELDELLCSTFLLRKGEKEIYFSKITKSGLKKHIDDYVSTCEIRPYS